LANVWDLPAIIARITVISNIVVTYARLDFQNPGKHRYIATSMLPAITVLARCVPGNDMHDI
jgi:hypothetical protein